MPIADLRPGCRIYSVNASRSTLTCFAIKPAETKKLYGVTARHCLPSGTYCWLDDPNEKVTAKPIGGPAQHAQGMDALSFPIDDAVKSQLKEQNFLPLGFNAIPAGVWDPTSRRAKVDKAPSAVEEERRKAATAGVTHVGSTTTWFREPKSDPEFLLPEAGTLQKYTVRGPTRITKTTIAPGDSGGPVIDLKARYVGLLSAGDLENKSESGDVLLLHDALNAMGLELASWQNRNHWQ